MSTLRPEDNISEILKTDLNKGFRLIVEKYSSRLYWHIRRLVIIHEDADDALQNTFINAWKSMGEFRNESTLSDNQLSELGDKLVDAIIQESSLAVTYHKKLKEVLPPVKVIRFYQAENQYKAQLLEELQGAKQQQRPNLRRNF